MVVASLALRANTPVEVSILLEELWGAQVPVSGEQALRNVVSQLRRKLGDARLETLRGGYTIRLESSTDAASFEDLAGRAHRKIVTAPVEADRLLDEAFELWRGRPYADLPSVGEPERERTRLEYVRELALEDRALGLIWRDPSFAVASLEARCVEAPERERSWTMRAAALYLSSRQAEALTSLREARSFLQDRFGLDPSSELAAMEQAVLAQDDDRVLNVLGLPSRKPKPAEAAQFREPQSAPSPTNTGARTWRRGRLLGRSRHFIAVAGGVLVLAVAVFALSVGRGSGGPEAPVTFRIGIPEPQAIDPAIVNSNAGAFITNLLFVSLTTLDTRTNELRPGVARTWERNADCTEWTFHLRPSHFSNGERVTAESFVRSYTRMARKSAASEVAGFLSSIQGFDALNKGTTEVFVGLDAVNAETLRIRTSDDCDFDRQTSLSEFSPVPVVAGDARNSKYNAQPVGNGPYRMEGPWTQGSGITLVRNDDYDLGPKPNIERIAVSFETTEVSFEAFLRGERDYARVPLRFVAEARDRYGNGKGFFSETKATLDYLYVSVNRPPFNSLNVRRAISLAIDRQKLVDVGLSGNGKAASSIIPPSFGAFYRPDVCPFCRHDPQQARELLKVTSLRAGDNVPLEYAAGDRNQAWIALVASDLESALGVKVRLKPVAFEEDSSKGKPGAFGLFQHTWEADYPTPTDFLARIFGTGSYGNFLGYSNPQFDDAIAAAIREPNLQRRTKLFAQAEDLALEDLPVIPLWNKTLLQVYAASRFDNVHTNFFDYPVLVEVKRAGQGESAETTLTG